MKRKTISILLLLFAFVQLSGCSIAPYKTVDISKDPRAVQMEFTSIEEVKRIIPNAKFERKDNDIIFIHNTNSSEFQTSIKNIDLGNEKEVTVKYYRNFLNEAPNVSIILELPNGKKYPAWLDTGFPVNILLTSDIALETKFEIFPFTGGTFQGICQIPEFNIGDMKTEDALSYYYEQQWQLRVLNIPIYSHPNIILGIEFIDSFDYVLFDNVSEQVTFSKNGAFEPDSKDSWQSYPFEIKPDSLSNNRIMVQMPVNGQVYELFFDTCGDEPGLDLNKSDWENISKDLTVKKIKRTNIYNWQSGKITCQKATISELIIAGKTFKNADVLIKTDDTNRLSMLSLGYFQDTTVVLDFVNNLLWIRS